MTGGSSSIESLPLVVLTQILQRLPFSTIVECKLVSKTWHNLVFDPLFSSGSPTALLLHRIKDPLYHHFISRHPGELQLVEIEDHEDRHRIIQPPFFTIHLEDSPVLGISKLYLIGTVNGLVCFLRGGLCNPIIVNPVTRECLVLRELQDIKVKGETCFGFGVNSQTGEYKIVRTFHDESSNGLGKVYTLGSGRWRDVVDVPSWAYQHGRSGLFVNNHCHWMVEDANVEEKMFVFDFVQERFHLFPSPPREVQQGRYKYRKLGVVKGRLALLEVYNRKFIIWVMRQYGVKESWHREVVIEEKPYFRLNVITRDREPMHVIDILKDGCVLIDGYKNGLAILDPLRNKIKHTKKIFPPYFTVLAFQPSFIKLNSFQGEMVHTIRRHRAD